MSLFDLLIGLGVFGYAVYALYRYTRKAKAGKCATCEIKPTCTSSCEAADWDQLITEALRSNSKKS
ncbi:FeoB-associated Cys-rich membrane protein [Exiguobacterium sp. s5]|uniref:FeoB-associated Cys-rich membrane protein n=1 Tax=Exiguobacterium sp. s5 TaxID=2751239 RepID=UPI001BEA90B0|nr:FeoB-associated Cys-rich membrane protein [Exiguobacterium sp. s5]